MNGLAVVTGASGGIGKEFAEILARDGYDLLLVARSEDRLLEICRDLSERYGIEATALPLDLSCDGVCERIFEATDGKADILINNAGFGDYGMYAECDWNKHEKMIRLNVLALAHLTRLYLPGMIERKKGRILNLASVASFAPGPLMADYYATKSYVLSLTEALAEEIKGTGVTISALCPGPTDTGFAKTAEACGANVFKKSSSDTADRVAALGYRKMMKGKTVIVCGLTFKLAAFFIRLCPRSAVRKIVYAVQKRSAPDKK